MQNAFSRAIPRSLRRITLFAVWCGVITAQVDTGTISGIVADTSGAVIPGSQVTVRHDVTNVSVTLTTNEAGFYFLPGLHPGHYTITAAKDGFETQRKVGVDVRVQDRLEVSFSLPPGSTSTELTVTATQPLLESETSSLGQVVEQKTLSDLPLNGRNFIQLATLTAGTLPSTRTAERDNFISNGARAVQNSYLLDGIDNKNRILGFANGSAQIVQPIIDGIEEFKVQISTFSAEFGQAAGGVVNVTMKSGTNTYHGNLFEFLRNSRLDANPYFQPAGGGHPTFIQNQFGTTFGGPIIKDKTFFFGSWQSSRDGSAAPQIGSVPLASERAGAFPSKITDPSTGQPFPGNTIPSSRWDPVAARLIALYPSPVLSGAANNYFYNPKEVVNSDNYNLKFDHHFRAMDYMFLRFSQGWGTNFLPTRLPNPANQQGRIALTQRQAVVSETHTVSSTQVNEFRLGFVYTYENQDILGPRLFDEYGILGAVNLPNIKGLPTFNISGFSTLGTPTTLGSLSLPATGTGNMPATKAGKIWELQDNCSWAHNRHSIRFGVDLQRVTIFASATNNARPAYTFNGTYTGSGLADFLLGDVYSASTSQQQLNTIQQYVYNGHAQDDWKVSQKLTLNFGLRYELPMPFVEEHDRQSNFVTDSGPCYLQLVSVSRINSCGSGLGRAETRVDTHNFAPRLGFAYQPIDKTIVRAGFGVFYGRDENLGLSQRLPTNLPWVSSAVFNGSTAVPAFSLQAGFPTNALSFAGTTPTADTTVISYPFNFPIPYVEQWNINIERQLPGSFVAQAGYTGSEAHKLPIYLNNVNQAYPGTGSVNSRRPYQGIGNIAFYAPIGNSHYDALIAKLERRFSGGLSLLASYTYGHSIDDGGNEHDTSDVIPQNVRDIAAQKASSNFDIRRRFVMSGLYQIPFGKGRSVASQLFRHWQLSGIFSVQTGQPFTATLSTDPSNTAATARPNRIADGNLPSGQRSPTHWFNTAAFVAPACICFGNSGRDILRGPGFVDLDFGIVRDFLFGDRFRFQVRAESFNLMNHPNLGLPNSAIGTALAGTINTTINSERQNQLALKLFF
jgi:hypothetical protein